MQEAIHTILIHNNFPLTCDLFILILISVRVEFNMRDRQVTEGEGNCDVLLIKAGKQTQDINVRVRALTVEQYEQLTGKIFDETFPNAEGMCVQYYNIKALNAV